MTRKHAIIMSSLLAMGIGAGAQEKWDMGKQDAGKLPAASDKKDLTFEKDIKPLFQATCVRCHGQQRQRGGLRLDSLDALMKGGDDGKMVVAGDSKKSLLVFAIAQVDNEIAMPPKRGPGGRGGQGRRPGGPDGGPPGAGGPPPDGGPGGPGGGSPPPPGGPDAGGPGAGGPGGGPGNPGGPGAGAGRRGQGGSGGQQARALTKEQVGLVRAWIDQGAK